MKKLNRFSHSSISTYQSCPRKYKLQRIDKISPIKFGSALAFGSAIDNATEPMLLKYKKQLSEDEITTLKMTPLEVFDEYFSEFLKVPEIRFSKSDLQIELFEQKDLLDIYKYAENVDVELDDENIVPFIEFCYEVIKEGTINVDIDLVFNYINIKSLRKKAEILLPLFDEWFKDNLDEVYSIQERIELVDGEDKITGLLDVYARTKDGVDRIIDVKTSSKPYKDDEANRSQQLCIYGEYKETSNVSFLVAEKKIRKREPRGRIQYVEGVITEEMSDRIFMDITDKVYEIQNDEVFNKNLDSCFQYGKCDYFNLCKNGSMKGLKKRES